MPQPCEAPVVPFRRQTQPADDLERAVALMQEADCAWRAGRHDAAIARLREAIALEESALGPDNPAVATARPLLGAYLLVAGDYAEAECVLTEAVSRLSALPDRPHESVAARALLAELYLKQDRAAEAEALLASLGPACEAAFGPRSPEFARIVLAHGAAHEAAGNLAEALLLFGKALDISDKSKGGAEFLPVLHRALGGLVRLNFAAGRQATALEYLDRLLLALPDDEEE
ncbi:MAG: tetratricopeptide repeat protein [Candidatus Sericytochromatia bacterium]|nr:tetratricopeptide repeat protein [Candidatus Tanganyikabacteria bacterium]